MTTEEAGGESGFVEQVTRGFVYYWFLGGSVGAAITAVVEVLNVYSGSIMTGPGTIAALGLAAVFANMEDPPRLLPFAVFGIGSFVISVSLSVLFGGSGSETMASVVPWVVGPAIAFTLVYLVGWRPIAAYARPT